MTDKWMYVLKNVSRLLDKPASLQEHIFTRFFEVTDIKRFSPEDVIQYEASLKAYRDNNNTITSAIEKGTIKVKKKGRKEWHEEGLMEGLKQGLAEDEKNKAFETARNLKQLHLPTEQIQKATGLTAEEIEKL